MHVFLYEWATGGGLMEQPGALPASLVREGMAMVGAVAADLTRIAGCQVTALRDPRMLQLVLPGCTVVDVMSSYAHGEEIERLTSEADATVLIAPEFDGILLKTAQRAVASGGRLISPPLEFIRVTADKHRTAHKLSEAGVPTPRGQVLESDEPLPMDFDYPAVLKPIDGAGSQDTYMVSGPYDATPAYAWPRRLETYVPGLPVSVAVLCGSAARLVLMPCKQRISVDGRLRYLGGELPLADGLSERATTLAERALGALPPVTGYVGVDLVLGRDPHGYEDAVIEVNPRFTTSYVGLRAATQANLTEAMFCIARGEAVEVQFAGRPLEFDPSGNVGFVR